MAHFEQHDLLSHRQHVFRKMQSCKIQLTKSHKRMDRLLDRGGQIDTLILDMEKKTFHTNPHEQSMG